jgi:hypothetical protein
MLLVAFTRLPKKCFLSLFNPNDYQSTKVLHHHLNMERDEEICLIEDEFDLCQEDAEEVWLYVSQTFCRFRCKEIRGFRTRHETKERS